MGIGGFFMAYTFAFLATNARISFYVIRAFVAKVISQ